MYLRACLACLAFLPSVVTAIPIGIYWTDDGSGQLQNAALDGSSVTTLISGLPDPQGLFATDTHLWWGDRVDNVIRRANPDGTDNQVILSTGTGVPRDLAVTGGFVYWTSTGTSDSISRANDDGTGSTDLITSGLSFPTGIVVTDSHLYWADSGTLNIRRSDLDGTNIVELVSGLPDTHLPNDILVTDQHLYWSTRDLALTHGGAPVPGTIQRADLDGSNIVTLIDGLVFPQGVVVTESHVYWADQNTSKIQRSNLDGTGITDLVTGLSTPVGLVVVAPVPLPPAAFLFVSGLGLLGWLNRWGRA